MKRGIITMKQASKITSIGDLSKEELMEFITILNKCMKDYDNDIEYRMKCSEKAEWDSIKSSPVSQRGLKRLQYTRNKKR